MVLTPVHSEKQAVKVAVAIDGGVVLATYANLQKPAQERRRVNATCASIDPTFCK